MTPNPPPELSEYQYDKKSAGSPLHVRVLGWLCLAMFVAAVCVTVLLSAEQKVRMTKITYSGFVLLFMAYVAVKIPSLRAKCGKCGQKMKDVEVKWTPDDWQEIQGYEQIDSLNGADGFLYVTEMRKETGKAPFCSIWAQLQVWCACHKCRLYFLKAKHSRRQVFASRDTDEFEKAKELLRTVPTAGDEIESAYKKAWDDALKRRSRSEAGSQ